MGYAQRLEDLIERRKIMAVVKKLQDGLGSQTRRDSIFKQTKGKLIDMGVYRAEDDGMINILAYNLMMWEETCKQVAKQTKMTIPGKRGGEMVRNPLFALQKQFMDAYMMAASNLGIGALARKKLGWEDVEEDDEDKSNPLKI
jgi:phage terminase small subunit